MTFLKSIPAPRWNNPRIYLALFLGLAFSTSLYSYWLVDRISLTTRQSVLYMTAASLAGAAAYYLLLELWIAPRLAEMTRWTQWRLMGLSVLLGIFLVFAGTNSWNQSGRYITFLLPNQTLTISVPAGQNIADPQIVVLGISTSMEDVAYGTINYRGWTRSGSQLILKDLSNNRLEWTGRTGEQAQVVLRKSPQGGMVTIAWNGQSQTMDLSSSVENKFLYNSYFSIPFYASETMLLLLVVLNFIVVCCALNLLIWNKREIILERLGRSILPNQANDRKVGNGDQAGAGEKTAIDWVILTGIMLVAIMLRALNLENLPPYIDEYNHLFAAKEILYGLPLTGDGVRALWIVNAPIALSFRIFGPELWSARLVGVLFNLLAIIPLYLIIRKVNRPAAVLACALYAIDPWIVSVARNVKEYAYYPFYFYWILYGMVEFIERFPNRFVVLRDWRRIFTPGLGLIGLVLVLPPFYGMVIDYESTFKIILVAYLAFGLFVLGKFDLRNRSNILFLAIAGLGVILLGYFYVSKQGDVSVLPKFDPYSIRYFFSNPRQQIYFDRTAIVYALALVSVILVSLLVRRQNFIPLFILTIFLFSMVFFTLFFSRNIRPRYLINVQFWFIMLIAIGLFGIWTFWRSVFFGKSFINLAAALILLILSFNFSQILLPVFYNKPGFMPITEEYHDNVVPAYSFLLDKVKANDILISRSLQSYVNWKGTPVFKQIYFYSSVSGSPQDVIFSLVKENESGWIVLDTIFTRPSDFLPHTPVFIGDRNLEYEGAFGDQEIWKWSAAGASH